MSQASTPKDAQSHLSRGHKELPCARMFLIRFGNPESGRKWIDAILERVSFCDGAKTDHAVHVAFTYEGLRFLGAPEADLALFSDAFRDGMESRAARLSDPSFAIKREPAHAVLTVRFGVAKHDALRAQLEAEGDWARTGASKHQSPPPANDLLGLLVAAGNEEVQHLLAPAVSAEQVDLHRPLLKGASASDHPVEYFGFQDGIRQPYFKVGTEREIDYERLAHFHLHRPESLLHGGSYLVVRQMTQDVPTFWKNMEEIKSRFNESDVARVSEKVMGVSREDSGTLTGCPFQSHRTRVNPHPQLDQDQNPGLIRRGLSFATREGQRGLMFMALVGDIERQFEFIQSRWIQRGNHVGATSNDRDPIAGIAPRNEARASTPGSHFRYERDGQPVSFELPSFVNLLWGEYFFAPTRSGLRKLARVSQTTGSNAQEFFQSRLAAEPDDAHRLKKIQAWLDDPKVATSFWEFVEKGGGYGPVCQKIEHEQKKGGGIELDDGQRRYVFVPAPDDAYDILADDGKKFSVSEFDRRMRPTTGHFLLGMDAWTDEYRREQRTVRIIPSESTAPVDLTFVKATASEAAQRMIGVWRKRDEAATLAGGVRDPHMLNELLAYTLNVLSTKCFGLPGPSSTALVQWGSSTANYHFRAVVTKEDKAKALVASAAYRSYVEGRVADVWHANAPLDADGERLKTTLDLMLKELVEAARAQGFATTYDESDLVRNLIGIITGSLAATVKLVNVGLSAFAAQASGRDGLVAFPNAPNLYELMVAKPLVDARRGGPDSLYRQYLGDHPQACRPPAGSPDGSRTTKIQKGDIAVVWLGGALKDKGHGFLFGAGAHACPGKDMAIAAIEGLLQGLATDKSCRLKLHRDDILVHFLPSPVPGSAST